MNEQVTSTIQRSLQGSIGQVKDLSVSSDEFTWQRPAGVRAGGEGHIEVAMPSPDAPQGPDYVLVRDSDTPGTFLAFRKERFAELARAIQDGQFRI